MTPGDAAAALAGTGLEDREIVAVTGGWAYWTFEVAGQWIVRFPSDDEVAAATARELALLPVFARRLPVAVPDPVWHGTWQGRPWFGYRKLQGHPLSPADVERSPALGGEVADFLLRLHRVDPAAVAATGAGPDPAGAAAGWRAEYLRLRQTAAERIAPLLDAGAAAALDAAFTAFLAGLEFEPVPVHRDLGTEHLLVHGNHLAGVIDWETATLGDPAVDFVGLAITLGPAWTASILDAYGPADGRLAGRIPAYVWLGAVHAVLYGLDRNPDITREGLSGLRRRLAAAGFDPEG